MDGHNEIAREIRFVRTIILMYSADPLTFTFLGREIEKVRVSATHQESFTAVSMVGEHSADPLKNGWSQRNCPRDQIR